MSSGSTERFEALERWSPRLLMLAGVLWGLEAATMTVRLLDVAPVPNLAVILTAVPALLVLLLALMGFYPGLAEQRPRLALAAVTLAAVALVAFAVQLAWLLATTLFDAPNPHVLVLVGSVAVMALSLVLFAVGSARVGVPSRTVGLLLVAFVVVWAAWVADFYLGVVPAPLEPGFHLLFAATTLGAGYAHWTGAAPLDGQEGPADATA